MDDYIGLIKMFAGRFAPRYYAFCDGQELDIQKYMVLYSLIGNTYGGDGRTKFNLPDLRGRMVIGSGIGKVTLNSISTDFLTPRVKGKPDGRENITLTKEHIPTHTHEYRWITGAREEKNPAGNFLGIAAGKFYVNEKSADKLYPMAQGTIAMAGGDQPHENMPPFLCMNFIICLQGLYPPREY